MKSYKHIIGFFIACILIGGSIGAALALHSIKPTFESNDQVSPIKASAAAILSIPSAHLLFVGDIMVDRGVENSVKNNLGGDFARLFENIGSTLKTADAVFGNLE